MNFHERQQRYLDYYSQYMTDQNFSQGFYVTKPKDGPIPFFVTRVEDYSGEVYHGAERAARYAVEEHNKKVEGGFLEFGKIVNLNVQAAPRAMYYITMSAREADGEHRLHQLKIWEKLHSGYQIQIFRPAPYCLQSSEEEMLPNRVSITGLMPWMDENYLYYKCFAGSFYKLHRVRLDHESGIAHVWLKDYVDTKEFVKKYEGKTMPHSDICFTFIDSV